MGVDGQGRSCESNERNHIHLGSSGHSSGGEEDLLDGPKSHFDGAVIGTGS